MGRADLVSRRQPMKSLEKQLQSRNFKRTALPCYSYKIRVVWPSLQLLTELELVLILILTHMTKPMFRVGEEGLRAASARTKKQGPCNAAATPVISFLRRVHRQKWESLSRRQAHKLGREVEATTSSISRDSRRPGWWCSRQWITSPPQRERQQTAVLQHRGAPPSQLFMGKLVIRLSLAEFGGQQHLFIEF